MAAWVKQAAALPQFRPGGSASPDEEEKVGKETGPVSLHPPPGCDHGSNAGMMPPMPQLTLRIAVWTVNSYVNNMTGSNAFTGASFSERLEALQNAVEAARSWFSSQPRVTLGLDVFLGPEYLFARSQDQKLLEVNESASVERVSRSLSQGILLIPGTISWKKPVDPSQDVYGDENAEKRTLHQQKITNNSEWTTRLVKHEDQVPTHSRLYTEYLIAKDKNEGKTPDEAVASNRGKWLGGYFLKNVTALHEAQQQGKQAFIARSTAYVFHDGRRILKYHKRGDATEVLINDRPRDVEIRYAPGLKEGHFELNPAPTLRLKCGLEACIDHHTGYVRNSARGVLPDLHFIASAEIANQTSVKVVQPGGYIVHASSNPKVSGVFTSDWAPVTPEAVLKQKQEQERKPARELGEVRCYTCTLDLN